MACIIKFSEDAWGSLDNETQLNLDSNSTRYDAIPHVKF